MRTKNSLELFEQAVASYKLSQCLSKPDNELYHAAFYFALHRFFSGEDFPLERLYETSPEMLFEQFYLYCQKHAEVLKDAKILQRNDPAAGVLLAVVFVQEEKKSARRADIFALNQNEHQFKQLRISFGQAAQKFQIRNICALFQNGFTRCSALLFLRKSASTFSCRHSSIVCSTASSSFFSCEYFLTLSTKII